MDIQAHKELTNQLLANHMDQAAVSGILAQLVDDYIIVNAELVQSRQAIDRLQVEAQGLKDTNMQLFLKIPAGAVQEEEKKPEEDKKPSFETLFANGELL
jgi:hypothetical protein